MTDETPQDNLASAQTSDASPEAAHIAELTSQWETRLANAEAQILTLQDGLAEIYQFHRAAKQRALMLRVLLLVLALGAFFYLRVRSGA